MPGDTNGCKWDRECWRYLVTECMMPDLCSLHLLSVWWWISSRFEWYQYWGIGPILFSDIVSNTGQTTVYGAVLPPVFYVCISVALQSNACYVDFFTADHGRHWGSNTQTQGWGAGKVSMCEIQYQQLICHVSLPLSVLVLGIGAELSIVLTLVHSLVSPDTVYTNVMSSDMQELCESC